MNAEWIKLQILWPDNAAASGRKHAVLLTNCTGRGLRPYLLSNTHFRRNFNLTTLETAPIVLAEGRGMPVWDSQDMAQILQSADLLITHNLSERHGPMSMCSLQSRLASHCAIITFVAPNCSCFWPWSYGYGASIGIQQMLDAGASRDDVWRSFLDGTFNPFFHIRWRLEIGRLADKETYHDIGIADFIQRNVRKVKLFNAHSHPTFHVIAHIGDSIVKKLGLEAPSEEVNLAGDHMLYALHGGPETQYEFSHFQFQYPRRYTEKVEEHYGKLLDEAVTGWQQQQLIYPVSD